MAGYNDIADSNDPSPKPPNEPGNNDPGIKPGNNASTFRGDTYYCQSCGGYLVENQPDCPSCRERIDWSRG